MDEELYEFDEAELLLRFGQSLNQNTFDATPPRPAELRKRASEWIGANRERVQSLICLSKKVQELATNGFSTELVAAVLSLLESLSLGTGASPLAVLLCRRGIVAYCSERWRNSGSQASVSDSFREPVE